jgi:AAA domain
LLFFDHRKGGKSRLIADAHPSIEVRVLDFFPERDNDDDVADWLEEGHDVHKLHDLVAAASVVTPQPIPEADISAASSAPFLQTTRADQVPVMRVEWLCPDRVPVGGLTLFDGPGGVGKSTCLTGVLAAASRGRDFFTGAEIAPQAALVVGIEDVRGLTAARLRLYGADMTRIHLVDAANIGGRDVPLTLPDHLDILESKIIELGIGIIYVDALFSHLNLEGEGKMAQQVRAALHPIGELCQRQNIALMAVRHWTKATGSALSRALGSVEFTNFARSVFTFGKHPNNAELVVCAHTKTNYGKHAGAIAFRLVGHDMLDDNGKPWQVSTAESVAPCEGVTSDDLTMCAPVDPDEKSTAADWLRDHLGDGETHFTEDVLLAALKAKLGSRRTIYRAADSIGVVKDRTRVFPSKGTWQLPVADDAEGPSRAISINKARLESKSPPCEQETIILQGFESCATVMPPAMPPNRRGTTGTTVGEPQKSLVPLASVATADDTEIIG